MRREIFDEEHDLFRSQFRRFAEGEIEPRIAGWNAQGSTDRDTWKKVGQGGYLGVMAPEEYGGAGADYRYAAIIHEELARIRAHALMLGLHSEICMPYLQAFGNAEQKSRYLPGTITGEIVLAIAMTEPGPAPIWPPCRPGPFATAITMWWTVPRPSSPTDRLRTW